MALIVHGAPLSPFVRKVMYLLNLAETQYTLKIEVPGSVPEHFVNISPLKKIPVLQDHDWFQADSSIICNYLIETLGHETLTSLIPSTAKLRAHMRWLEKFADYELAPKVTFNVFRQRIMMPIAITSQLFNFMHAGESINNTQWPTLEAYFERMLSQPIWRALVEREQITLNKMHQAQVVL